MMVLESRLFGKLFLALFVVIFPTLSSNFADASALKKASVMAPLFLKDEGWDDFNKKLTTVKQYGVDSVTVDVWWGEVEKDSDNSFDWSYYKQMFSIIKNNNLKIIPIFSFHECKDNVGDDCFIPLPSWIWSKYVGREINGIVIRDNDLKYKSEQGNFSDEVVQLWADDLIMNEYTDLVRSFITEFGELYKDDIAEINVSLGPSGELRYPSYNTHDKDVDCPNRGSLQSYSRLAQHDFRVSMLQKYSTLQGINDAWGLSLPQIEDVRPPSNADFFFRNKDYITMQYGKDFIDWLNQSLVNHGAKILRHIIQVIKNTFPKAVIGYKIPGVHWCITHPAYPRAAEVAAGLIQTSVDFNSKKSGFGYENVVSISSMLSTPARNVVLHFTCLEMENNNKHPNYSLAKCLVHWVADEAQKQNITIMGENALSGTILTSTGWYNIRDVFRKSHYAGFTALRLKQVTNGIGKDYYSKLIQDFSLSKDDCLQ